MNYIINPSLFYWMNVSDSIRMVFIILLICSSVLTIISFMVWVCDDIGDKVFKRTEIICCSILVLSVLGIIFIPTKNTLIEMQVAKFATYENAEWTVEAVKSAVDYIIEAIKNING